MQSSSALLALLVFLPSLALALRCYDYMRSSSMMNPPRSDLECPPGAAYCMKSIVQNTDVNGFISWVENRNCANFQLCQREGCVGTPYDSICCCRGDYCNPAARPATTVALVAGPALYLLSRMF